MLKLLAVLATVADDPVALLEILSRAADGQAWIVVAAAAAGVLTWALRRLGLALALRFDRLAFLAWFSTDRGGAVLAIASGAASAILTAYVAGELVTPLRALLVIAMQIATYVAGKKIAAPSDRAAAGVLGRR